MPTPWPTPCCPSGTESDHVRGQPGPQPGERCHSQRDFAGVERNPRTIQRSDAVPDLETLSLITVACVNATAALCWAAGLLPRVSRPARVPVRAWVPVATTVRPIRVTDVRGPIR